MVKKKKGSRRFKSKLYSPTVSEAVQNYEDYSTTIISAKKKEIGNQWRKELVVIENFSLLDQ